MGATRKRENMETTLPQTKSRFTFRSLPWEKIVLWAARIAVVTALLCYFTQFGVAYAIDYRQVLPRGEAVFIIVLRWMTIAAVCTGALVPFFGGHRTKGLFSLFGLAVGVINLVFLEQNFVAWGKGRESEFGSQLGFAYTSWRAAFFVVEQVALILGAVLVLVLFIKDKEYKKFRWSDLGLVPAIFLGLALAYLYPYLFEAMARCLNYEIHHWYTEDFSPSHLAFLAMNPILIISGYVIFRDRDANAKRFFLTTLGLSSLCMFFYSRVYSPGYISYDYIPIHLCNLATVLITLSFAFGWKSLFYFTFFVNVIGTVFAMTMPDASYIAFSYASIRFWYNHVIVFSAPILGVVLKIFSRPKLVDIGRSIVVFTLYFLLAATMNAWISNYHPTINYFFINDDFYLKKVNWTDCPLRKAPYIWTWNVFGQKWVFYPAYHLMIYFIYIVLMFLLWYLYDALFYVGDAHRNLHIKKRLQRQGYADLKKLLNGRSPNEPIYEEAIGMIQIRDFTKIYSGATTPSVDHLTLTIGPGEVYGFLGHNGAGKSTTIKSLVGIQSITGGQIIVNGFDVAKQPVEAKLTIGYVSDNHAVYERLTGREYINYIADLYMVSQEDRDARIAKYTKMFNLEDAIDREVKSYSHGMKQKLVVIASLIHDPKVWVLDEPLTGLDPTSAFQIKECMREHASRGNIVFFSSHVIEVVEKICTRICIISHGKLMCEYSLEELRKEGISLEELYLKYVSSQERIR